MLWPDNLRTTMKFTQSYAVTVDNLWSELDFAQNSIFDPDKNPGILSNQPLGYDQWSPFYKNYIVYHSRIKVSVLNSTPNMIRMCIRPRDRAPSVTASFDWCRTLPYSVTKVVDGRGAATAHISNSISTKLFAGQRIGSGSQYISEYVNDPPDLNLWTFGFDDPFHNTPVIFVVTIWYKVRLLRREDELPPSV